jgi:hypothetical protein
MHITGLSRVPSGNVLVVAMAADNTNRGTHTEPFFVNEYGTNDMQLVVRGSGLEQR